ncbi:MAG: peptidoglycan DD-metalloendopeptidase family protein [Legionellales bacterium]|nr:peptidoglycan DD-metalloendopeptidase family protein [Legionellales bacterium]
MNWIVLFFYCVLGLIGLNSFTSANANTQEQQLKAVHHKIKNLENDLTKAKNKQKTLEHELKQTETQISRITKAIRQVEQEHLQTQTELSQLRNHRKQSQSILRQQQLKLGQELNAYYQLGQHNHLKLLLDQTNVQHINRLATYVTYLNKQRQQIIDATRHTLQDLHQTEQAIEQRESQLSILKSTHRQEQLALQTNQAYRQQVLTKLNQEIAAHNQQLVTLKQDQQALKKVIDRLQKQRQIAAKKPFSSMKKQLKWPVKGKITQKFGVPIQQNSLKSTGVFISTGQNKPINAIHSGEVVFADWLRGYGLLIIVDHGDGYMSLYGHNQVLFKNKGDKVTLGENLASSGNSGGKVENGLYFEIRHHGKPINPEQWCV